MGVNLHFIKLVTSNLSVRIHGNIDSQCFDAVCLETKRYAASKKHSINYSQKIFVWLNDNFYILSEDTIFVLGVML